MRIILADDHPLYLEAVQGQVSRQFPEAAVRTTSSVDDGLALLSVNSTTNAWKEAGVYARCARPSISAN